MPLEKKFVTRYLVLITYITPKGRLIFQFCPTKMKGQCLFHMRLKKYLTRGLNDVESTVYDMVVSSSKNNIWLIFKLTFFGG